MFKVIHYKLAANLNEDKRVKEKTRQPEFKTLSCSSRSAKQTLKVLQVVCVLLQLIQL